MSAHKTKRRYEYQPQRDSAALNILTDSLNTGNVAQPSIPARVRAKYPNMALAANDAASKPREDSLPSDKEWSDLCKRQNRTALTRANQQAKRTRSVVWLAGEEPDKVLETDPFLKERGAPHGYCKKNAPARRYKRSRKGFVTELPPAPSLIDRATVPGREASDVTFLLNRAGKAVAALDPDDPRMAWCFARLMSAGLLRRDGHFDLARSHADDVILVAEGQQRGASTYEDAKRNEAPITVTFVR